MRNILEKHNKKEGDAPFVPDYTLASGAAPNKKTHSLRICDAKGNALPSDTSLIRGLLLSADARGAPADGASEGRRSTAGSVDLDPAALMADDAALALMKRSANAGQSLAASPQFEAGDRFLVACDSGFSSSGLTANSDVLGLMDYQRKHGAEDEAETESKCQPAPIGLWSVCHGIHYELVKRPAKEEKQPEKPEAAAASAAITAAPPTGGLMSRFFGGSGGAAGEGEKSSGAAERTGEAEMPPGATDMQTGGSRASSKETIKPSSSASSSDGDSDEMRQAANLRGETKGSEN